MYLLFENFRKYLEEEAITDVSNVALYVEERKNNYFLILYNKNNWKDILKNYLLPSDKEKETKDILGYIRISKENLFPLSLPCWSPPRGEKTWYMQNSAAQSGYGPLMYDLALSYVKLKGYNGLVPDRNSVSKSAEKIWSQYYERGLGVTGIKVNHKQLDNYPPNNKTPETEDDCYIHRNKILDQLYFANSTNKALISKLIKAHEETFLIVKKNVVNYLKSLNDPYIDVTSINKLEKFNLILLELGQQLFDFKYHH